MNRLQQLLAQLADDGFLASLSDDDLATFIVDLREAYAEARAEELTADSIAVLQQGAEAVQAAVAHENERVEEAARLADEAAALDALVAPVASDPADPAAPEGDPADPAADPPADPAADPAAPPAADPAEPAAPADPPADPAAPAPEAIAAGGAPATPPARVPLARLRERTPAGARPQAREPERARVFAAAGVPNVDAGGEFTSQRSLAEALISTWDANAGADGVGVKVPVARVQASYPTERQVSSRFSAVQNSEIFRAGMELHDNAITAAGGICAPTMPYYEQAMISHSSRPVRDSLAQFNADRGGINWIAPPTLASIVTAGGSAAIGQVTAAQDAANVTKTHQFVTCGAPSSAQIYAVTDILEFGNMMQRTFPELVQSWVSLAEAAFSRFAENLLLTAIANGSTAVTTQQRLGAARDLLNYATLAAVAYRNRHRMPLDAPLVAMFPSWVIGMIQSDIWSAFNTGDDEANTVTRALIEAWFASRNIRVTWFEDGVGPGSPAYQIFPTQAAGLLNGWPTVVQWYLFHEGAWLFLDGGTLDLGIVRDSTLNSQNRYQLFMESFENVVFVGIESLRIRSTVCVNGATSGTVNPTTICTGGS